MFKKLWTKFKSWFDRKWDKAGDEAEEIWDDLRPGTEAIIKAGGKAFLDVVYIAVSELAQTGFSNEEKRIEAKKKIQRAWNTEKKGIIENTINLAIEQVYSRYKSENS